MSKNSGYNVIHFTPCQDLSTESHSSYSIRDHLRLISHANPHNAFDMNDLATLIDSLYTEWRILSISDLVYNHMANDSEFLKRSPNSTYNMRNSPHLIPAFVLDRILYHVTVDIMNGAYEDQGISAVGLNAHDHNLETLRHIIRHQEMPKHRLEEFGQLDLNKTLDQIKEIGLNELEQLARHLDEFKSKPRNYAQRDVEWQRLVIVQDPQYRRLSSSVDADVVRDILRSELEHLNLEQDLNSNENSQFVFNVYARFYNELNRRNEQIKSETYDHLNEAVNNVILNVQYHFFAHQGPRWQHVDLKHPIAFSYFYFPFKSVSVGGDEALAVEGGDASLRIQAHNGWVMNDDPLKNFATKGSLVYIKRYLIPWGDSVKLRFGDKPEDSPELWAYMEEYTRLTAKIFHGVRLDNCHSTPLHVAKHFLVNFFNFNYSY